MAQDLKPVIEETLDTFKNETVEKIDCLSAILSACVLDDEQNNSYRETSVFQNAFTPNERKIIKAKIFKLIDQL
jgi:hypothetical protein